MAIFDLANPYDREGFLKRVQDFLTKGGVVHLSKKHPSRSVQQNKYFYLILGFFACEFGYSVDEAKMLFKSTVNPDLFVRTKINKFGKQVHYLRSSSELTTAEMTTAIERFRNYAASVCGIYISSPEDRQFITHCEKVIEENKEYVLNYA